MDLASLTRPELIYPRLSGTDTPTVLRALADRLAAELPNLEGFVVPRLHADADEIYRKLLEREELGSTGIGAGVAIPHCKLDGLDRPVLSVGLLKRGIDFGATDGEAVRVFLVLLSPASAPAQHLQALAAVSKWVKTDGHVAKLQGRSDPDAVHELLRATS
jgi:nitrogen PTS system EIIA component